LRWIARSRPCVSPVCAVECGQCIGGNAAIGKGTVERSFIRDQRLAHRRRFRFHRVEQRVHARAQFGAEFKLVRKLEHMQRAGIVTAF